MHYARIAVALAAAAVAAGTSANPLPRQGAVDHTHCTGGDTFMLTMAEGVIAGSFRHNGMNRGGLFDGTVTRCNGTFLVVGGKTEMETGTCEIIDKDGDRNFSKFSRPGGRGTYQFLAGTGKYKGITGEGWFDLAAEFPPPEPGKMFICFKVGGNYKLP